MKSLKSPKCCSSQNLNNNNNESSSSMIPKYVNYYMKYNNDNNNDLTVTNSSYNHVSMNSPNVIKKHNNITNNNNNSSTNSSTRNSLTDLNTTKWIEKFCSTDKFLCKIDVDFITDSFNLIGLDEKIPHYHKALSIILGNSSDTSPSSDLSTESSENFLSDDGREIQILSSAENLYGLIHARYILTDAGLKQMLEKYKKNRFGLCSRYYCDRAPMLPIGLSDEPNNHSVRLYCPKCMDLYAPHFSSKSVLSDGAWFGTSFPHMFFMVYPEHRPLPPKQKFTATLYGFKIHQKAYEYQREQFEAAERAKKPLFLKTIISTSMAASTNTKAVTLTTTTATTKNGDINDENNDDDHLMENINDNLH